LRATDPWNGRTLEWAPRPAPVYNFAIIPASRIEMRSGNEETYNLQPKNLKTYQDIEMPKIPPWHIHFRIRVSYGLVLSGTFGGLLL